MKVEECHIKMCKLLPLKAKIWGFLVIVSSLVLRKQTKKKPKNSKVKLLFKYLCSKNLCTYLWQTEFCERNRKLLFSNVQLTWILSLHVYWAVPLSTCFRISRNLDGTNYCHKESVALGVSSESGIDFEKRWAWRAQGSMLWKEAIPGEAKNIPGGGMKWRTNLSNILCGNLSLES